MVTRGLSAESTNLLYLIPENPKIGIHHMAIQAGESSQSPPQWCAILASMDAESL